MESIEVKTRVELRLRTIGHDLHRLLAADRRGGEIGLALEVTRKHLLDLEAEIEVLQAELAKRSAIATAQ